MEENKQQQQQSTAPQSWKDINLGPDTPVSVLISFINVLNQRLCLLEDHVSIKLDDGRVVTVTELFKLQEEAAKAAAEKKGE